MWLIAEPRPVLGPARVWITGHLLSKGTGQSLVFVAETSKPDLVDQDKLSFAQLAGHLRELVSRQTQLLSVEF